jgi:hypothetical protein
MAKTEVLLVGVLIVLALMLGLIFGGSSVWFLKPDGGTQTSTVVNKYVCMDGSVKDNQNLCPVMQTDGTTTVACPPCECTGTTGTTISSSPYKQCSCTECAAQCGSPVYTATTTSSTLPPCQVCNSDLDCGSSSYSELKCQNGKVYKTFSEPVCEEDNLGRKCCKIIQTTTDRIPCATNERCVNGVGCMPYEDED